MIPFVYPVKRGAMKMNYLRGGLSLTVCVYIFLTYKVYTIIDKGNKSKRDNLKQVTTRGKSHVNFRGEHADKLNLIDDILKGGTGQDKNNTNLLEKLLDLKSFGSKFDHYFEKQMELNDRPICQHLDYSKKMLPLTALASFPGSGNTWMRHLIQQATGE